MYKGFYSVQLGECQGFYAVLEIKMKSTGIGVFAAIPVFDKRRRGQSNGMPAAGDGIPPCGTHKKTALRLQDAGRLIEVYYETTPTLANPNQPLASRTRPE